MKAGIRFPVILAASLFLTIRPLLSHSIIWNQDPWIHLYFANALLEHGTGAFTDPLVKANQGVYYFPLYHIILGGLKAITGLSDWDIYRFLYITLPVLGIILTERIGSLLFNERAGFYAAIVSATSFFLLENLYIIGLTYNVLLIDLGLLALICINREGRYWNGLGVFFALAASFTHLYGALFALLILIYKGREGSPYAIALLYPVYVIISEASTTDILEMGMVRNTIGHTLGYIWDRGIFLLANPLMQMGLLVGCILYFIRWEKKNQKSRLLGIWVAVFFLAWIVSSVPFAVKSGNITLYESDRFLYYLVFPAAIFGGRLADEFIKKDKRAIYGVWAVLLVFFFYPALSYSQEISDTDFPLEKSYNGLMELRAISDMDDITITHQIAWVNVVAGRRGESLNVPEGGIGYDILTSPPDIFFKWVSSEEAFYTGISSVWPDKKPSYIFLSNYEIEYYPHTAQWFRHPRERFELIYDDGDSMIIKIL